MSKYYRILTNCSKKNNKAIANIPIGEIVDEGYWRFYSDGRTNWRDQRVILVKVRDIREFYDLYKWLKKNGGFFEIAPQTKVGITKRPIKEYVRPLAFEAIDESELENKMQRTYHIESEKLDSCWVKEKRKGKSFSVKSVQEILDGNLDVLNEARYANCQ